jgi:hypothetical protein
MAAAGIRDRGRGRRAGGAAGRDQRVEHIYRPGSQSRHTRDEWLDQLPTYGGHSQFPPAKLEEVLAGIGAAIDTMGGSFTMRYTTVAVTAARTSART